MNDTIESIEGSLGITLDMGLAGALVAVVIMALGFIRTAVPSFPSRWVPLITWVLCSLLYPLVLNEWSRESIIAGLICGVIATGTHSGVRKTVDPEHKVDKKLSEVSTRARQAFGKSSQTNR